MQTINSKRKAKLISILEAIHVTTSAHAQDSFSISAVSHKLYYVKNYKRILAKNLNSEVFLQVAIIPLMPSLNCVDCNFLVGIVTASAEWNILWHKDWRRKKSRTGLGFVWVVSFYFGVGVEHLLFPNLPIHTNNRQHQVTSDRKTEIKDFSLFTPRSCNRVFHQISFKGANKNTIILTHLTPCF